MRVNEGLLCRYALWKQMVMKKTIIFLSVVAIIASAVLTSIGMSDANSGLSAESKAKLVISSAYR